MSMSLELRDYIDRLVIVAKENGKVEEELRWQKWRAQLLDAWANDSRALMTALLEGGPDE